jgi:hypothetical protein
LERCVLSKGVAMKWTGWSRWTAVGVTVIAGTVGSSTAKADAVDPDAARIEAAGHSLKWNWTPPGHSERYGHAETLIHAPLPAVRTQVLDYARYHEFMPTRFKTSRVVGHGADGSADLYSQILVLHGLVTLWSVTHFKPPQAVSPGTEIVEGRMVPGKGNIDDLHVVWTMRAIDEQWTVLKADMLIKPGLPAPQWALDEELRDSAMFGVDSVHDKAQGRGGIDPWNG